MYEVEEILGRMVDGEAVCTKKERDTMEGWDTWEELVAISGWEIEEDFVPFSEPLPT